MATDSSKCDCWHPGRSLWGIGEKKRGDRSLSGGGGGGGKERKEREGQMVGQFYGDGITKRWMVGSDNWTAQMNIDKSILKSCNSFMLLSLRATCNISQNILACLALLSFRSRAGKECSESAAV